MLTGADGPVQAGITITQTKSEAGAWLAAAALWARSDCGPSYRPYRRRSGAFLLAITMMIVSRPVPA